MRTEAKSDIPLGSKYTPVNFWVRPEPEVGDRDTTVSGPGVGIQVPFCTQPLFELFPPANRYTFCCPVNAPLKVRFTVSVRLSPDVLKEEPVPFNVHWLFDTVAVEPGVIDGDMNPVPALVYNDIRLLPGE